MRQIILALSCLVPTAAGAACGAGDTNVLSCSLLDRQTEVSLCIGGDTIFYAYGGFGEKPEVQLSAPVAEIESRPWSGIGRTIWETVTFRDGDFAYEVNLGATTVQEGDELVRQDAGGVAVFVNGQEMTYVECDAKSATAGIWAVSDAKEAAGICWNPNAFEWETCATE